MIGLCGSKQEAKERVREGWAATKERVAGPTEVSDQVLLYACLNE